MRWLIAILMALVLFSCATVPQVENPKEPIKELVEEEKAVVEVIEEIESFSEPLGYEILQGNFQAQQLQDVIGLLMNNLKLEPGVRCSSPKEIYERGTATVNELCIMFTNIAYVNFGTEIDMAVIDTREIFSEGFGEEFHLMPCYEGIIYNLFNLTRRFTIDSQTVKVYKFREIYDFGFKPVPLSDFIIVPDSER